LANWIAKENDQTFYHSLVTGRPSDIRRSLMHSQRASADGAELLFGFDEYVAVWVHEDGSEWLIRDLICIRVVEALAANGFLAKHPELTFEHRDVSEKAFQ
jgi:hypothetical protein